MKKKQGFTLVELLVVMAIIAILASIALPNVTKFLKKARANRALAEIQGIDLAITSMLADANRSSLHHLFNAGDPGRPDEGGVFWYLWDEDAFEAPGNNCGAYILSAQGFIAAQELYTRTVYALMREGRAVLSDYDAELDLNYDQVLNKNVVKKLGSSYNTDLTFDPWDNLYQIYPGPWPAPRVDACSNDPFDDKDPDSYNVFRIYQTSEEASKLPGTKGGATADDRTCDGKPGRDDPILDPVTEELEPVGYAAPRDKNAFIYSMGENLLSSQSLYRSSSFYDPNQAEEFKGGGDDINNWDKGQSWMVFYN